MPPPPPTARISVIDIQLSCDRSSARANLILSFTLESESGRVCLFDPLEELRILDARAEPIHRADARTRAPSFSARSLSSGTLSSNSAGCGRKSGIPVRVKGGSGGARSGGGDSGSDGGRSAGTTPESGRGTFADGTSAGTPSESAITSQDDTTSVGTSHNGTIIRGEVPEELWFERLGKEGYEDSGKRQAQKASRSLNGSPESSSTRENHKSWSWASKPKTTTRSRGLISKQHFKPTPGFFGSGMKGFGFERAELKRVDIQTAEPRKSRAHEPPRPQQAERPPTRASPTRASPASRGSSPTQKSTQTLPGRGKRHWHSPGVGESMNPTMVPSKGNGAGKRRSIGASASGKEISASLRNNGVATLAKTIADVSERRSPLKSDGLGVPALRPSTNEHTHVDPQKARARVEPVYGYLMESDDSGGRSSAVGTVGRFVYVDGKYYFERSDFIDRTHTTEKSTSPTKTHSSTTLQPIKTTNNHIKPSSTLIPTCIPTCWQINIRATLSRTNSTTPPTIPLRAALARLATYTTVHPARVRITDITPAGQPGSLTLVPPTLSSLHVQRLKVGEEFDALLVLGKGDGGLGEGHVDVSEGSMDVSQGALPDVLIESPLRWVTVTDFTCRIESRAAVALGSLVVLDREQKLDLDKLDPDKLHPQDSLDSPNPTTLSASLETLATSPTLISNHSNNSQDTIPTSRSNSSAAHFSLKITPTPNGTSALPEHGMYAFTAEGLRGAHIAPGHPCEADMLLVQRGDARGQGGGTGKSGVQRVSWIPRLSIPVGVDGGSTLGDSHPCDGASDTAFLVERGELGGGLREELGGVLREELRAGLKEEVWKSFARDFPSQSATCARDVLLVYHTKLPTHRDSIVLEIFAPLLPGNEVRQPVLRPLGRRLGIGGVMEDGTGARGTTKEEVDAKSKEAERSDLEDRVNATSRPFDVWSRIVEGMLWDAGFDGKAGVSFMTGVQDAWATEMPARAMWALGVVWGFAYLLSLWRLAGQESWILKVER